MQNMKCGHTHAVTSGGPLVWLVWFQPDHFFLHPWLTWRRQLAPLLGRCPRKATNHTYHLETCEMAANSVKELFQVFLSKILHSSKRTIVVLQASSVKGVACEISEPSESQNQCCTTQLEDFIHVKLYCLAKNGPQKQSKHFLGEGGACHQTPLAVACLCTDCEPDHTKPDGYGPVVCPGYKANSACTCHAVAILPILPSDELNVHAIW